jgi:ATP-dependent DNA ligase
MAMETGDGELILKHAGKLGFEGVVSKTIDAPYAPGNRGLWRKAKALNRQEFVIVGWSDPEGSRPHLGGWCQSNGRSSMCNATAISRAGIYAARARHSAKAAERLCL